MKYAVKRGSTSNWFRVKLKKDGSAAAGSQGKGFTGATISSTGLIISTIADNEATATVYTAAGSTIETITTLGTFATPTATKCRFKEVDATNHPGLVEVQLADARYAVANSKRLNVTISGISGMLDCDVEIQLTQMDVDDGTRGGMTALPNANAEAAGGLYTRGSGAGQVNQDANGRIDANVKAIAGTTNGATLDANNFLKVDLEDWRGSQPNALTSSRVDASVGAMANNTLTAAAIAASALNGKGDWLIPPVGTANVGSATAAASYFFFGAGLNSPIPDLQDVEIIYRSATGAGTNNLGIVVTGVAHASASSDGPFIVLNHPLNNAPVNNDTFWIRALNPVPLTSAQAATATQTGLTAQGYTTTRAGYLDTLNGLVQAVWDKATSALTTVGSIGKKLADWVVGTIDTYTGNTKQTGDAYAVVNDAAFGNSKLVRSATPANALAVDLSGRVDLGKIAGSTTAVTLDSNQALTVNTKYVNSQSQTARDIGASVIAASVSAGGIASSSFAAGAINSTVAPNLDAAVSSRLATSGYTAPDNADIVIAATNTAALTQMTSGTGAARAFTVAALANAPAGGGGGSTVNEDNDVIEEVNIVE